MSDRFLAAGFEAGYVWDPHTVSVNNKQVRKPKKDGWYDHGQNCLEYLEHNFGGVQPTWEQTTRRALALRDREGQKLRRDYDPYDAIKQGQRRRGVGGRGGY